MTEKQKRYTSKPRIHSVSVRLTESEKATLDSLCVKLDLTISETLKEGIKALDEKYRLLKD